MAARFEAGKALLAGVFGAGAEIVPFGSTAVCGLSAQPTVDITVLVPTIRSVDRLPAALSALGFVPGGDHGFFSRRYIVRHAMDREDRLTHVHVYEAGLLNAERELLFCAFLQRDEASPALYQRTKEDTARQCRFDPKGYTNAKTETVEKLLQTAWESGFVRPPK